MIRFWTLVWVAWSLGRCVTAQETVTDQPPTLHGGPYQFVFATPEQGRAVLGKRDIYVEQMSPFDRKARMHSETDPGVETYLSFVQGEVRPWKASDREAISAAIESLDKTLREFKLPPLGEILLIHTTGREEGGAAYTRGTAIILPVGQIGTKERPRPSLIAHELFHVISRSDRRLRDRLYKCIGFRATGPISLPADLATDKMTNPDAPVIEHVMDVKFAEDKVVTIAPVLFAKRPYDHRNSMSMFSYMKFQLMEVTPALSHSYVPTIVAGKPMMHEPNLPDFHRQIGGNTSYIIHPEEILADNFAILVAAHRQVADQWLLDAMREVLESPSDEPVNSPERTGNEK